MGSGVRITRDNAQAIFDALKQLGKKDVLVGIPAEDSDRDDVPFGNAGIGYINEFGSPAQNIPARPHLTPGVRSVDDQTLPQLEKAATAILSGDQAGADRALNRAGIIASGGVKRYLNASGFTPLADSTVAARARRGRKGAKKEIESRKAGNDAGTANAKPLIDTGQYRNSITYIVRDK